MRKGTRDEGRGTRDEGRGMRDEGRGTRDEGRGNFKNTEHLIGGGECGYLFKFLFVNLMEYGDWHMGYEFFRCKYFFRYVF